MAERITTFLLAEDDLNDVFLVEKEFKSAPVHIRLRHVVDGVEAKAYMMGEGRFSDREQFPLPDVILLDLNMPRFNGFDFLAWLHSESPGNLRLIPVVVMSSSPLQKDVTRAYELGVNSFVTKPVNWVEFKERIRALGIYWADHVEKPQVTPKQ